MRTYVIAARQTVAVEWCRSNGVEPYARSTVLATTGPRLRGHTITSTDRVVDLGGASDEVYDDLGLARLVGEG